MKINGAYWLGSVDTSLPKRGVGADELEEAVVVADGEWHVLDLQPVLRRW